MRAIDFQGIIQQHKARVANRKEKAETKGRVLRKVSTTEMADFMRCRQRWDYSSLSRKGLEPIEPVAALQFGTGIHACLDEMYTTTKKIGAMYWEQWLDANADKSQEGYQEMKELGQAMLEGYAAWSEEQDADEFTGISHVLATELEFEVFLAECKDTDIYLVGRWDMIIIDPYERIWLVDHKTSKTSVGEESLHRNWQMYCYVWALQEVLQHPIEGVYYNVLRKKIPSTPRMLKDGTLSIDKNQDTTLELYKAAMESLCIDAEEERYQDILRYLESKGNTFFQRHIIRVTHGETLEQNRYMRHVAWEMASDPLIYPHVHSRCYLMCPYAILCEQRSRGFNPDSLVKENFRKRVTAEGSVYQRDELE